MKENKGRRAAILDVVEDRLRQISIKNGYNLDIALIQKRFPTLGDLTRNCDPNEEYTDSMLLGPETLPGLFLQYGTLGLTIDRAEVTAPMSSRVNQSEGRSNYANINQLQEGFPIVIRGIVREGDPVIIQCKTLYDSNTDLLEAEEIRELVNNPRYSMTPNEAQIQIRTFDLIPSRADNTYFQIEVTGPDRYCNDDTDKEITDSIRLDPCHKLIYQRKADDPPDKPDNTILSDDFANPLLDADTGNWKNSIDSFDPNNSDPLYASLLTQGPNNKIECSDPFKLNEFTHDDLNKVNFLFRKVSMHEDSTIDPNTITSNVSEDNIIDFVEGDSIYVKVRIGQTDETSGTDINNVFEIGRDPNDHFREIYDFDQVKLKLFYATSDVNLSDLKDDDKDDDGDYDGGKDLGSEGVDGWILAGNVSNDSNSDNFIDPNNFTYAVIQQEFINNNIEDHEETCLTIHTAPFRMMKTSNFDIINNMVQTEKFFTGVNSITITEKDENGEVPFDFTNRPTLSYIEAVSLPIPLTTLISMLHADVQRALYDAGNYIEPYDAGGIIKELVDCYRGQDFKDSAVALRLAADFENRVTCLIEAECAENQPTNTNLGIRGIEDFYITDWYTSEGVGSPFECIDFRLVVWHTFRKGTAV